MENKPIIQDDEIDLLQLVKTIWAGRKIIFISIAICFLFGLIVAMTSPVKYKASATLLPSSEKKGGSLGGLSSLAGLAGINLGGMLESSGIDPALYPKIIQSYPFQKELIYKKFNFAKGDNAISIYDYVKADSLEFAGSVVMKYTIKLPFTLLNSLNSKAKSSDLLPTKLAIPINKIDIYEARALGFIANIAKTTVDNKSGLIVVEVEMGEPILTAQITTEIVSQLQHYVIDYKTQQIRQKLVFVEQNYKDKKADFEKSQRAILDYKDQNRNVVSERINSEYQRLSDNYDISSTVYKGIAQQLEQVKLQVKEETPVFTVIEPVQLPQEKSAPRKSFIIAFSMFLGVFLGVLGVILSTFVPALNSRFSFLLRV